VEFGGAVVEFGGAVVEFGGFWCYYYYYDINSSDCF
jgi:hypothetical protein